MSASCTDPRVGDLLAAWILGSCTPAEEDAVRAHLGACAICAEDAVRLGPAREALLTAVAPAPAPGSLKAAVMREVRAEARLFADVADGGPTSRAEAPPSAEVAEPAPALPARAEGPTARAAHPAERRSAGPRRRGEGHPPRRFRARIRRPRAARVPVLVAACSVLLLAGVVASGGLGSERVVTALVEPSLAPGGSAEVRLDDGSARLEVAGLPGAGPGRRYQVWTSTGDAAPRPTAARFAVDAAGVGAVDIPVSLDGVDRVLVTSEPAAGSRRPTRAPVLRVEL